ncbi:hypothetical protein L249_4512 [Ophiocordyceps polyrhachis-furcata BCC 54312]|uniref:Uncharacterized protein n=1 Tax=Ophiocordyceps polyrhachis-furcata BCC 54312 TaxID=1330021 RepID=A0A367KZL8_9HYPO|nr:hypothetical protein L249_4512 [Ophiocordyceps polyrhachis-furcata BCC 54312]
MDSTQRFKISFRFPVHHFKIKCIYLAAKDVIFDSLYHNRVHGIHPMEGKIPKLGTDLRIVQVQMTRNGV